MTAVPAFAPLREPPGWPPPEVPPPGPWEVRLREAPVVGSALANQFAGARWNRHARETYLPLGRAIGRSWNPGRPPGRGRRTRCGRGSRG